MLESQVQSQINAATAYEQLLVPALFGRWAATVADSAQIRPGQRVLDVACGTGVLAREIASRVGRHGRVAGLDPNAGMLQLASQLAGGIEWRQGTAESLPYPDHAFDVVVSQFGLMFFADRLQAVREITRVLAPRGRLALAVWDSLESNPAYAAEVHLLDRMAGIKAGNAVRAPFALGDRVALMDLLAEAGVPDAAVTSHIGTAEFPSVRVMVEADLRGWLPVMGVVLAEDEIGRILTEAEIVLERYVTRSGTVAFATQALIVTGTAP